jgi:poly-beta-hydroxyalkanoate depolymerase
MKKLVATVVALTTLTVNAVTINELMNNKKVALTAFGVADYYTYNCAGLTHGGQKAMMQALYSNDLHLLTAVELMNTEEFRAGFEFSARYTCNDLRSVITDAGAGALIR